MDCAECCAAAGAACAADTGSRPASGEPNGLGVQPVISSAAVSAAAADVRPHPQNGEGASACVDASHVRSEFRGGLRRTRVTFSLRMTPSTIRQVGECSATGACAGSLGDDVDCIGVRGGDPPVVEHIHGL